MDSSGGCISELTRWVGKLRMCLKSLDLDMVILINLALQKISFLLFFKKQTWLLFLCSVFIFGTSFAHSFLLTEDHDGK